MTQRDFLPQGQVVGWRGEEQTYLAQTSGTSNEVDTDPLIDQGANDAIYFGLALLVFIIIALIGVISGRAKTAILLALFVSGLIIAVIVAV
jgi:phosphoglycerol transferase MdoB-like AlkP superfamily enzyme